MRFLILLKTIRIHERYIVKGTVMNVEQWMNVTGRYGGFDLEIGSDKDFFKLYDKNITILEKIKYLQDEISDLMDNYFKNK